MKFNEGTSVFAVSKLPPAKVEGWTPNMSKLTVSGWTPNGVKLEKDAVTWPAFATKVLSDFPSVRYFPCEFVNKEDDVRSWYN